MTFDKDRAFTVDESGVGFEDVNDNAIANISTEAFDPSVTGRDAPQGSIYMRTNGDAYGKIGPATTDWKRFAKGAHDPDGIFYDMKEPTGYVDRADSQVSFNSGTQTFTIAPLSPATSFTYYIRGVPYVISTTKTVTIPNVTGTYFIYFDETEALQYQTSFDQDLLSEKGYTAIIFYNSAVGQGGIYFADERHGLTMDGETHYYLHTSRGTVYVSGFGLTDVSVDGTGSVNTEVQIAVEEGVFYDEDLRHSVVNTGDKVNSYDLEQQLSPLPAQIPVFYRLGAGVWYLKPADDYPFIYSGDTSGYTGANSLPPYNEYTGGSWQLTEVGNNRYFFVHIFAINDPNHPVIAIQGIAEYQNKPQGRDAALVEIRQLAGLPFAEFTPLGSIICQAATGYSSTPKTRFRSTDDGQPYVDWRTVTSFGYTLGPSNAGLPDPGANGVVVRTEIGTTAARTITGTTAQITLSNGDGVAGNPTVAIATNPVLPGTGSVTIPTGTTAQRSSPATDGMIRTNTDASTVEYYVNGGWKQISSSILVRSAVPTTYTGIATENTLVTWTVPGGTLGNQYGIRLLTAGTVENTGAGNRTFTFRIYYGSTVVWADTTNAIGGGTVAVWDCRVVLTANNATNAQLLTGEIFLTGPTAPDVGINGSFENPRGIAILYGTCAIDSTTDQTFKLTCQASSSANTISDFFYLIEKV